VTKDWQIRAPEWSLGTVWLSEMQKAHRFVPYWNIVSKTG